MSIQTSGVIVSFSFYICVMGFDSWWGGCGKGFGDFVCLVPQVMSLTPPDFQEDRMGRFEGSADALLGRHPSLPSSLKKI